MAKTFISSEEAAELRRLYAELPVASQRAAATLRSEGQPLEGEALKRLLAEEARGPGHCSPDKTDFRDHWGLNARPELDGAVKARIWIATGCHGDLKPHAVAVVPDVLPKSPAGKIDRAQAGATAGFVGMRDSGTVGGEAPMITPEKAQRLRAKMLEHLEAALAITDELQSGTIGYLIERALDQARAEVWPSDLDAPHR